MIGSYGQPGGRTALALVTVTVAVLVWLTAPVPAATVVQDQPVNVPDLDTLKLNVYLTNNDSGAVYNSGELNSALLGGLGQQVQSLPINQDKTLDQVLGAWSVVIRAPPTGEVAAGWHAQMQLDGQVTLSHISGIPNISYVVWKATQQAPNQDMMALTVSIPKSLLAADGDGWSAEDPRDWKVVISQQVVPQAFIGHQGGVGFVGTAYTYTLARPDLPGDANADSHVDVTDLLYLVEAFGTVAGEVHYDPACDFNDDDSVDVVDLLTMVEYWGV